MKNSLTIVAVAATSAVAVLSGGAVVAFASPVTSQTAVVGGVAALEVPLGHHPSASEVSFGPLPGSEKGFVVVPAAGASTLPGAPAPTGEKTASAPEGHTTDSAAPGSGSPESSAPKAPESTSSTPEEKSATEKSSVISSTPAPSSGDTAPATKSPERSNSDKSKSTTPNND